MADADSRFRAFSPGTLRAAWWAFDRVFGPWMRRRIAEVHLAGVPDAVPAGPLLLCPNHVSWWDGFLMRDVHRRLRPDAAFHTVVLERELRRHPFLRLLGAIPLRPGSVSGIRSTLREVRDIRRGDRDATVVFFCQGRLWPSFRRPLGFKGGVGLVREALEPAAVLPVGIHLEPGGRASPSAWISLGSTLAPDPTEKGPSRRLAAVLEAEVEGQLDRILSFLAVHGEDAPERWPGATEPLESDTTDAVVNLTGPRALVPGAVPWSINRARRMP